MKVVRPVCHPLGMAGTTSFHHRVAPFPTQELIGVSTSSPTFDLVIAANRLPVDRVTGPDGEASWRRSPGGLVTAIMPMMQGRDGAWLGWAGTTDEEVEPFTDNGGLAIVPGLLSAGEGALYYQGFSNNNF